MVRKYNDVWDWLEPNLIVGIDGSGSNFSLVDAQKISTLLCCHIVGFTLTSNFFFLQPAKLLSNCTAKPVGAQANHNDDESDDVGELKRTVAGYKW